METDASTEHACANVKYDGLVCAGAQDAERRGRHAAGRARGAAGSSGRRGGRGQRAAAADAARARAGGRGARGGQGAARRCGHADVLCGWGGGHVCPAMQRLLGCTHATRVLVSARRWTGTQRRAGQPAYLAAPCGAPRRRGEARQHGPAKFRGACGLAPMGRCAPRPMRRSNQLDAGVHTFWLSGRPVRARKAGARLQPAAPRSRRGAAGAHMLSALTLTPDPIARRGAAGAQAGPAQLHGRGGAGAGGLPAALPDRRGRPHRARRAPRRGATSQAVRARALRRHCAPWS